jgi:2-methylisocitrate lyase-like PEP mutase family enzyme
MPDLQSRARTLLDLHTAPEILVLANVWDVISAQVVSAVDGVKALATASHSIAATFGYQDGENIPLELHLDMVKRIVDAVDIPVTMDFEAGYGDAGATAAKAIQAGVVGGNLEDQMKPLDEAVDAVKAVLAAGKDAGIDFVLNARTDAFLKVSDPSEALKEAIERGRAYLDAGASNFFVPGKLDEAQWSELVSALGERKVNMIGIPGSISQEAAQRIGLARISFGPWSQNTALTALAELAERAYDGGGLAEGVRKLN